MESMEDWINNKLDTMSILDFVKVIEEVKWLRADIDKINQQPQQTIFDPVQIASDEEDGLIDLLSICQGQR